MKWRERIVWALLLLFTAGAVVVACRGTSAVARSSGTVLCTQVAHSPCIVNSASGDGSDTLVVSGALPPALCSHVLAVTDGYGNDMLDVSCGQVAAVIPICTAGDKYNINACLWPGTFNPRSGHFEGPPYLAIGGIGTPQTASMIIAPARPSMMGVTSCRAPALWQAPGGSWTCRDGAWARQ